MGPLDIIEGTAAGVLSDDLHQAAMACLSIDPAACVDLAARYSWEASIGQFSDNLKRVIHRSGRAAA